jgi:hypothetical protein
MKSLLVVEAAGHPKVLENQYFLFKEKFNISFLVPPDKHKSYNLLMPNVMRHCSVKYSFHSTTIFFKLIFAGYQFDYIHISTGPEGKHYSTFWSHPLFYICCLLYGKKTLLTIKNSRAYLDNRGIFYNLLHMGLPYLRLVMFETKTLMKHFLEVYPKPLNALPIFDRYTDLLPSHQNNSRIAKESSIVKVGLLGSLDDSRRDYDTLLSALNLLNTNLRDKLQIVILGACPGGESNDILIKIRKIVKTISHDGYLSADEFDLKGLDCDLLISPLLESMEYGTFKGSGAFGDAIYLRKNIIFPSFVDPEGEFKQISYYYSNKCELADVLSSVTTKPVREIGIDFIEKYDTKTISQNIIKEINQFD